MQIQLSDQFSYRRLIRFTFPAVVMNILMAVYGIVDGLFVSNFAGETAFAAVNLIYPVITILGTVGYMLGTGGSAIVANVLGQGEKSKASEYFSMFSYLSFGIGLLFTVVGILFMPDLAGRLGAEGQLKEYCIVYGKIIMAVMPFNIMQYLLQGFFIVNEKPNHGLYVTIAAGVTNILLDAILVIGLPQEQKLFGAALATAISQFLGGAISVLLFLIRQEGNLRFTKAGFHIKVIIKACANGSSEFMNSISSSFISILFNAQLMRLAGQRGVAAYGIMMYITWVFAAVFMGYAVGTAPIVSFKDGAEKKEELKELFCKSIRIISALGVIMFAMAEVTAYPLAGVFVHDNDALLEMTVAGFRILALSFTIMGIPIWGSSYFTALNDGVTSALISFVRNFVFQAGCILFLPALLDMNGIWIAPVAAELLSVIVVSLFFITKNRKQIASASWTPA